MSEEKIEDSTPEPPEDVQIPEPVVARKPLSETRLAQLAKARERAAEVKRERKEQKLRDKVAVLDQPVASQKKEMGPMNPVLIVEQSESDDDSFEGPPGVLFVKRRRQKKPERSREEVQMDFAYHRMFPSF